MTELIQEADLTPAATLGGNKRLSLGAACWSLFEGARNPYVVLITIYIFMPYVAQTVVGDAVKGQEIISRWSQYSGWAVMATAPFLGASIDKLGGRKIWLALIVALMVPMIAALWWTKPDHSGLSVTATLALTTAIGILFTWSEVLHNSLLVRAAGLSAAHKASGLALALGNGFALLALGFTAWAFALPGLPQTADWAWLPKAPLFGLSRELHQPERVVALMAAGLFAIGAVPLFLFTPDAPPTGIPVLTALRSGASDLWGMVKTVGAYRNAAIFLGARMFYVDGMTAILIYAGVYATGVMRWRALEMLFFGIILSVLAVLGGFVGRWLDNGVGPKRAVQIEIGMSLLGIIAFLGMSPDQNSLLLALGPCGACQPLEWALLSHCPGVDLPPDRILQRCFHHSALRVEPHLAHTPDAACTDRRFLRRLRPLWHGHELAWPLSGESRHPYLQDATGWFRNDHSLAGPRLCGSAFRERRGPRHSHRPLAPAR